MRKCVKLLAVLFVAAVFFQCLCMPAFAITESEVEAQVASSGKAAVTGNVLIWFLCAVAFLKVSQKIDSFMASLGVNVGRTGGSLLSEAMIAMRALTMVVGGKGGGAGGVKASVGSGGGRAASTGMTGFFKGGLIGMAGRHITNSAVKTATSQTSAIHTARSQAEQAAGSAGTDGGSHGNAAGDDVILDSVPGETLDTVSGTMTGTSPDAAAVGTAPDPVPGAVSGFAAQNDAARSDEEVFSQGSPVKAAAHSGAISPGEPPQEGVILTGAEPSGGDTKIGSEPAPGEAQAGMNDGSVSLQSPQNGVVLTGTGSPAAVYEADPSPEAGSGPEDSVSSDGTLVQTGNDEIGGNSPVYTPPSDSPVFVAGDDVGSSEDGERYTYGNSDRAQEPRTSSSNHRSVRSNHSFMRGAALPSLGGAIFSKSLASGGSFANNVIGTVARGEVAGNITGDMASRSMISYMAHAGKGGVGGDAPSYSDVEIGRGRITGVETAPGSPEGREFAMYHAEQYAAPTGEYAKVTSADGTLWYKQYAQDAVERKPYKAPDDTVAYQESIVKRLPTPPKRKDRI